MLDLGVDAYYKIARDLHRQRHFRPGTGAQRLQLRARVSTKASSSAPNTTAAISRPTAISPSAQEKATDVVSNQYLFDNATPLADLGGLTEFQYIETHWIYTDHNQFVTGSAGASYQFCGRPAMRWRDGGQGAARR